MSQGNQRQSLSIQQMELSERPREKMLHRGSKELTTAELLAIILRTGTTEMNVIEIAQCLLSQYKGSLYELYRELQVSQTKSIIKGVGTTKGITLLAALELGIRLIQDHERYVSEQTAVSQSREVYNHIYQYLFGLNEEELWLLTLNNAGKITSTTRISKGGIDETTADIKVILKTALKHSATGIIIIHNHPSGNLTPSNKDDEMTQRLYKSCELLDINMLDHLIFTDGGYFSYLDNNRL